MSAGGGVPRAWPPATGGGSGRPPGSAICGASAGAAVRGGSGLGPGPGAGQPGDDGSAGRAGGLVGGAWCCWGTDPPCLVAGTSSVPDVAEAQGVRHPVGPWVRGCPASEGRAVVASVGVAVCVRFGRLSVGVYVGSAAGRSGAPWCGRGSGWACVVAAWLAADRGPCAGATGGVRGCGLPVGLGAGTLCGCAVPGGFPEWVPTAPVFVGPGRASLLAGDARCPRLPCGRVVLCWSSLRRPFGRTLLSGALWCASPSWCRTACSPRGVGGVLLVWFGGGCGESEGGWVGGCGGHRGRRSGPYVRGPSRCRGARSGQGGW